jgi:hypothetical protein
MIVSFGDDNTEELFREEAIAAFPRLPESPCAS